MSNKINNLKEIKKEISKKSNIYFLVLIFIIFVTDRISKLKIIRSFSDDTYYLNDFINLDLIWNIGIGFGLLSTDSSLLYNFVSIIVAIVIIYLIYILIISDNLDKFILSIIIGGALGNFYDRLIYKAVPDFIDVHYNNFHWFTFNIADIFITMGIMIFIIRGIFIKV